MLSRISANGLYRSTFRLNMNSKIVTNRSMHSAGMRKNANTTMRFIFSPDKRSNILRLAFVRHASDGGEEYPPSILENIPDIPSFEVPTPVETILYHANGEAMFSSIGLGGYSPVGLLQYGLEWLHVGCGLPWWAAVITGTVIVRLAVLPVLIDTLKTSTRMQHHFPQLQKMQAKISQARQLGDSYEATAHMFALQEYMKKNNVSMFRCFLPMVVQMPIFLSFFLALRQMASKPVESLTDGGLFWFTDLTVADPYYILPLLSTCSMFLIIHLGSEGTPVNQQGLARIGIRIMPLFVFPFTLKFQTIVFCYWLSSNCVSLVQGQVLRSAVVRKKLNLPDRPTPSSSSTGGKTFLKEISDAWSHAKVMKQLNDRNRANTKLRKQAASDTPLKTYKYDPTKRAPQVQILAKKRDV